MARPKTNKNTHSVNILKRAIQKDFSKGTKTKVNETPVTNETVVNESPVINETVVNESPVINETVVNETPVTNETVVNETPENKISIFDDIKQPTKEDSNIGRVENIVNDIKTSEEENEVISSKEANKAKASIIVELIDTGFMFICLLITWDFTKENQKFYTLHDERKKAIKYNLQKIYDNSNKKSEPKKVILWLILGSYAPLLVLAVFQMINRFKERKEKLQEELKEKQRIENENRLNQTNTIPTQSNSVNPPLNDRNNFQTVQPEIIKTKTDGRGRKPFPRDKYGNIIRPNKKKK